MVVRNLDLKIRYENNIEVFVFTCYHAVTSEVLRLSRSQEDLSFVDEEYAFPSARKCKRCVQTFLDILYRRPQVPYFRS